MKTFISVLIVLFTITQFVPAQQAVIKITTGKNPKKVQISFANSKGEIINTASVNQGLTPNDFHKSDFIYLFIEPFPKDEWTVFNKKMIQNELNSIAILQKNLIVQHESTYPFDTNFDAKGNITGILLNFKKQMIDITSEFRYTSQADTSEPIRINERYWEGYDRYLALSQKGNEQYQRKKYLDAFETLKVFVTDTTDVKGLSKFSFTEHNQKNILMNCSLMYSDSINRSFSLINHTFSKTFDESLLSSLDSLNKLIQRAQGFFSGYLNYMEANNDLKAKEIKDQMSKSSIDFEKMIKQNKATLEKRKLAFLSRDTYDNFSYELYVDLITKMLIQCDSIVVINKPDTLNINILIEHFPERYNDLNLMKGWKETFEFLIRYINQSIVKNRYVFADSILQRIEDQKGIQKQPFFEIINAFNWFGKENYQRFRQYLDSALITATDPRMISNIQNWLINIAIRDKNLDYQMIQLYNEGLKYSEVLDIDNAMKSFEKVLLFGSKFAPVHYQMAKLFYQKNEGFTGELRLQSAIQIDSSYISAWIMYLEKLFEAKEFTRAEELVNKAIRKNPIWKYYFLKASILEQLENVKKIEEGITLIDKECIPRNKYFIDQYYLLADLYLKSARKDKIDKAKQTVLRVPEITNQLGEKFEAYMKKITERVETPTGGRPY